MDLGDYKKFWRGEFSIGQAFWMMYLGINAALVFGMFALIIVASWLRLKGAEEFFVTAQPIPGYTLH
jgi:hypothetical protein